MGATKLHSRSILRNLVKTEITATYMNDVGRQRVTKYVSKKFEKNSKMSKQFNKEMHKIKELTKEIISENARKKKETENENSSMQYENDQINQKLHSDNHHDEINVEASIIDKNENEDKKKDKNDKDKDNDEDKDNDKDREKDKNKNEDTNCVKKDITLKNKFHLVNRILYKYQMLKLIPKYKCTSSQSLLKMKSSKVNVKQESESNVSSTSLQQIANNSKTTSLYNSIKMNLTMQKSLRTEKGVNEVFGFMDIVQNNEKNNSSNITYRYCINIYNHISDKKNFKSLILKRLTVCKFPYILKLILKKQLLIIIIDYVLIYIFFIILFFLSITI